MKDLLFKVEELQNLINFINDKVPTKYGVAILKFIDEVAAARTKEAAPQVETEKEAAITGETKAANKPAKAK